MEFEDFKKYADKMVESITTKINKEEKEFFDMIIKSYNDKCERIVKTNDFIYYNLKFIDDNDLKQGCDIKSEALEPLRDILEENKDTNNAYLEEFKDYMSLKQELNQYKDKVEYYENFEINKTVDKIRLRHNKEIKKLNNIINVLDKQNRELGEDLSLIEDKLNKTNWWLENMLKQATNNETKAIINGTLELLGKGNDEE